jgi:hypothetical protein
MNRAPAKDLIPILVKEPSLELLRSFFRARVEWSSYPIFHERMMSSSLFDDYVPLLEETPVNAALTLDYALLLALEEDERYVLSSVYLISFLCYCLPKEIVPSAAQLQMIEELHKRVKPLTFLSNLSSFWEAVASYAARSNPDLEKELHFSATKCPDLPQYQLAENESAPKCPVSIEQLGKWLAAFSNLYQAELLGSMKVNEDDYWVFSCYKITEEKQKEYSQNHLFVHRSAVGVSRIFSNYISFNYDESLRQEIIRVHYSPWLCESERSENNNNKQTSS